jgi:replicative DNA helicase
MRPPQANSRYGEVSALSRGLKLLSGELGLPLLVVCQLNRNIEHDGGGRAPILSDLRDSGAIEQDADIVIFLHRSVVTEDQAEQEKTSLILAAQRNGPTDRFDIRYIGKFTRFVEGA